MKTLTVGELIEKLKKMPKSANVFMLTDRTESNWDEENAKFIRVHGIEYVEKKLYILMMDLRIVWNLMSYLK